jgi:serine/threonine protein kinase/Tol biopolymer transport system component
MVSGTAGSHCAQCIVPRRGGGSSSGGSVSLNAGNKLGPYVIEAPLGAGGMGEVYRARDTRLNRTVAIKVLSARLPASAQFSKRFHREARVIASLEHPHICPLYDVGEEHGITFLVMQHLHGETLAERLRVGPLPFDRAIQIASEIAGALDAAHRAGVVHRDLKPANVMVTKTGVKLLDFGLARVDDGAAVVAAGVQDATVSAALTDEATVLGTLPYMAPEQLEGRPADARTDIFALGAVLYEMTTGRRPFAGASHASLVAAIMSADPPALSVARGGIPPSLERVVRKCLAKDPDARWQDAGDLAAELQWVGEQDAVSVAPAERRRSSTLSWALRVGLAAAAGAIAAWALKPAAPAAPTHVAHVSIDLPPGAALENFSRPVLAISPDGRRLVYVARLNGTLSLFLREIGSLESKALTETDVGPHPFFSPDGNWVAFRSSGALKKIAMSGGAPVTILPSVGFLTGASWSPDDRIVFVGGIRERVSSVAASGGVPAALTTLDAARHETSHRYPEVLPGGQAIMFLAGPPLDGAWHEATLVAQSLENGQRHQLIQGAAQARYVAPGYLVYARAGTLYAVAFDEKALRVVGAPVAMLEGVREDLRHGAAQFVVSANGALAYISGGLETTEVVWVDRQGRPKPLLPQERRWFGSPSLSPDGGRLAVNVGGGNDSVFVHDLSNGGLSRVTHEGNRLLPMWTSDGKRITAVKTETREMIASEVDGRGPEEVLYRSDRGQPNPESWSPDGHVMAFAQDGDIWTLTLPERRLAQLTDSRFTEGGAKISPDGRWLAYTSNESGQNEVYVQEFPTAGQRWMISKGGGTEAVWGRDSQTLYFRRGPGLMAAAGRPPFRERAPLFEVPWAVGGDGRMAANYDVAPDGQGFIMIRSKDRSLDRIYVIFNWVDELKRRVPRASS